MLPLRVVLGAAYLVWLATNHNRYDRFFIYALNYDRQQRVQDLILRFGG